MITAVRNAYVSVGSSDLSNRVKHLSVQTSYDEVDITPIGSTQKIVRPGLGQGRIALTLFQDFAAGEVDAILRPLLGSSSSAAVAVRPTNAAVAVDNPELTINGQLLHYSLLDVAVGDVCMVEAEFFGPIITASVGVGGGFFGDDVFGDGYFGGDA